jgi:hypothetical protein
MLTKCLSLTARLAILPLLACSAVRLSAQDAFGYTASSAVPYSYQNIAGTGASVLTGADDGTATLTIPFNFRFYGINYTSVCVSSNGLLSFGGCVTGDYNNLDLTAQSPAGNRPLIAPFWMDLSFAAPGAGSVFYQTLGAAAPRRFVVQWSNVSALNLPGTLNFQVILHENTNQILYQYENVVSGSPAVNKGAGATVGIRDTSGQANNRRIQWSYKAPVLSNSQAIRFTPPPPVLPTEVTSTVKAVISAFSLNRVTNLYSGTVTITNIGATPIARPISVVLTNLTAGVTAAGAAGEAPGLGPYYLAPGAAALGPKQSVAVPVQFRNPSTLRITFTVRTFSGSF